MRNLARLALALLFLGAPLAGCTTNATTGRSQIAMMSRDEEVQMGQQLGPEFSQQSGGEVGDPQLRAYVTEVGTKLSAGVVDQDKSLPWKFTLLNSDVINAFALPGGQVFFSLGLGRLMTNEAQMAGVIGHEIGHVTARHINERMGDQLKANILASIVGVGLGDTAGGLAQQAAEIGLLKYSRGQESEADYLGMKYMAAQGYDPAAQGQVMQILVEASKGSSQPEFLSTHPDPARRVKEVADRLKTEEFAHTQNNPQYQLYPERFKQRFLDRLAALPKPPPPPPPPQGLAPSSSNTLAAGVMGPPSDDVLASLGPPSASCAFSAPTLTTQKPHDTPPPTNRWSPPGSHRMPQTFGWLEVRLIGEFLAEKHEGVDPLAVRFVELRRMVEALPGFKPDPAHPVNEKILETIQQHWNEEYLDLKNEDEDD